MASDNANGGKVLATAIVSLAIGILVGLVFGGGNRDDSKNQTTTEAPAQTVTTKAADFRNSLNGLLREHAAVTVPALKAELQQDADAAALKETVDTNSQAIASAINGVYSGKKDDFLALWRQHIGYYSDYLGGAMNEDETAKQTAKADLKQFADTLAVFLTDLNTELRQDDVRQATALHGEHVTQIIDAMVAGDSETVYKLSHEAYEHMGTFADMLAKAVVEQMPDKY
jgi:hypothetical protein